MGTLQTLPLRSRFDQRKFSAIAIERPAIVLIQSEPHTELLLARRSAVMGATWALDGVRLVKIPGGAARWVMMLLSIVARVRFTHEWLFMEAHLEVTSKAQFTLQLDQRTLDARWAPYPFHELTESFYRRLLTCRGRVLIEEVEALFPDAFPARVGRESLCQRLRHWLATHLRKHPA